MARYVTVMFLSFIGLVTVVSLRAAADDVAAPTGSFSFAMACGQSPGVEVESDSIAITTIAEPVSVHISNGEYSINGAPYTAEPGMVSFGQTVSVRHVAATGDETMKSTILTVGGMSAVFTSSTEPCLRGTR